MRVAVTGASGFVGGHVLDALAHRPDVEIIALSRRPMATEGLPAGASWAHIDISRPSPNTYGEIGRPDVLIHLAWKGLPNYQSPRHLDVELPSQIAFLSELVEAGLPSLLVAGTCYEYGMLEGELVEGSSGPLTSTYAQAKVALHDELRALQEQFPFALTWARLFYMWGSGQSPNSLFPLLQAAVERGDERFPMSRGDQVRDYLPVEEVARIIVKLALLQRDLGPVNVCSGRPVAIREVVEGWLPEHDWRIDLQPGVYPYPEHEPFAFWGSTRKLKSILGTDRALS